MTQGAAAAASESGVPGDAEQSRQSLFHRAGRLIRRRLVEGLLVAVPIVVTFWIVRWLYTILNTYVLSPLAVFVLWKVRRLNAAPDLPDWFETYAAPIIAILAALTILYVCGALAHYRIRKWVDQLLLRVPVVSPIYDGLRTLTQCLAAPGGQSKSQRVVLVPFPSPEFRLPAFVTSTSRDVATNRTLLSVYVPTTPIPTSGFFLMIPEDEVTELNWDIQQTLQTIISGGLTTPPDVTFYSRTPAATDARRVSPPAALSGPAQPDAPIGGG